MSSEKEILLNGYVSMDNDVSDADKSHDTKNIDDYIYDIEEGLSLAGKIIEQINILNNSPINYDLGIYDDLISYNNERIKNTHSDMRERKERKNNIERLNEKKKQAKIKMLEFKKQKNRKNYSDSNLTKLNVKKNNNFNFLKKDKNNEPLIRKKQKQAVENDTKNKKISERRAEILYGGNEEKNNNIFYLQAEKNVKRNELNSYEDNYKNINYVPDISNPEKTLFPNGTLADMPLMKEPLEDVKRDMEREKENVINQIKEKEINLDTIGKVKLGEVIPDVEKYIPPAKSKDEKRAEIIYRDMKNNPKKDLVKDYDTFKSDIRLIYWALTRIEEEVNKKLVNENKEEIKLRESLLKLSFIDFIKELLKVWNNRSVVKSVMTPETILSPYLDENDTSIDEEKMLELEQAIQDYINGSYLTQYLAETAGKMPDAASVIKISGKKPIQRTKHLQFADIYNSSDELPDKYKSVIKAKLNSQHIDNDTGGVYFYPDSDFAQRVAKSPDLREKIKTLLNFIPQFYDKKNLKNNLSDNSFAFPHGNLYYALNNVDVKNLMFTPNGDISGDIIDTTDFNTGEVKKLLQAGRELQELEKIQPKFLIIHFVIPKEDVNEIRQEINNEIIK